MAAEKAGGDVGFAEAFDTAQGWMALRARALGFYWLVDGIKLRKSVKLIRQFTDYYVRLALEKKEHGAEKEKIPEKGEKKKYALVEALVNETRDSEELRDQMLGEYTPEFPYRFNVLLSNSISMITCLNSHIPGY